MSCPGRCLNSVETQKLLFYIPEHLFLAKIRGTILYVSNSKSNIIILLLFLQKHNLFQGYFYTHFTPIFSRFNPNFIWIKFRYNQDKIEIKSGYKDTKQ